MRAKMNEIKIRPILAKINQTEIWFFEKIHKIDKSK